MAEQPATKANPGPQAAPSQPGDVSSKPTQTNNVIKEGGATGGTQRQPKLNPGPRGVTPQLATNPKPTDPDDAGFRHTAVERRAIQRGKTALRAATGHADILGSSTENHRISAASQPDSQRHLVYVGKLSSNTTTM